MTPTQIICRRLELGLTLEELAFALGISPPELHRIETGQSDAHNTREFADAFDALEERVFGSYVGA